MTEQGKYMHFPGRFPVKLFLNEMATSIRDAGPTDALFDKVADIEALNEYTRPNMHAAGCWADIREKPQLSLCDDLLSLDLEWARGDRSPR